jgi:hypothetical protein
MVHKTGKPKLDEWMNNWGEQFEELPKLSDDQLDKRYDELESKKENLVTEMDDVDMEISAIEDLWNVKPTKKYPFKV